MVYKFFEELKKIITENISNFFKKIKYIITIIMIIILFFSILLVKTDENESNIMILGKNLDVWESWITIIAIPITAGWAIHQYYKNSLLKKQEKAAEIAKLFSDELLDKCSLIGDVIEKSNLKDLLKLKEIDARTLQRFDREEMIELYKDEKIFEKYASILLSKNVQFTYLHILEKRISTKSWKEIEEKSDKEKESYIESILKEKYSKEEITNLKEKKMLFEEFEKYCLNNNIKEKIDKAYIREYSDEDARQLFILDNKYLPFIFSRLVSEVLNELEYICMYISSQSAGSYFVYQSIHQIFLRTVKAAALNIAYTNKNYSDKYYTNIIHVYKEWYNKREFDLRKEKNNKRKAYKYLEPKIKTV